MAQNGDLFDSTGLKQIFQMLLDQSNGQPETLAKNAITDDVRNLVRGSVKDINNITIKEIDKIIKALTSEMRSMFGGNAALTGYFKLMTELLKQMAESNRGSLNETQIVNRIIAALSNAFQASYEAKRSGQGTVYVNYDSNKAKGDPGAQKLVSALIPQEIVKVNSTIEKVLNFLNGHKSGEKTRQRNFIDDLVEGLARSKFVGGALSDFIKLGALFLATWLKDKGTWGKVLAVGLVAAAPVIGAAIAGALVKGITSLFTKTVGLIATAILTPVRWLGGKIGTWVTQIISAIWASSAASSASQSVAQTGASDVILYDQYGKPMKSTPKTPVPPKGAGGRIGPFGYALAATAANVGFGMVSNNTNIDPRLVHSVSGITQGALLGAATKNPYVIAAGAIIGGLYGLIKGHYEKQEELGEEQLGELRKKKGRFWDNIFGGGKDSESDNYGGSPNGNFNSSEEEFVDPLGHKVISQYGMRWHPIDKEWKMHHGVDIVGYKEGDSVSSRTSGTVTSVGWQNGYGNTVVMKDEATGIEYLYGHFSKVDKSLLGKHVSKGQTIGQAGATGKAEGVHVHFESRRNGVAFNPAELGWSVVDDAKRDNDKFSQNVIDYWDSQGKNKGFLHSKAYDYKALANRYKEEYVTEVLGLSPELKKHGDVKYRKAFESDEARDYANQRIAEYVAAAKSIKVEEGGAKKEGDIIDVTESASTQAKAQWDRINQEFKEEAKSTNILSPDTQNLIDFAGTETCSRVLQNVVNAQQQAYVQQR